MTDPGPDRWLAAEVFTAPKHGHAPHENEDAAALAAPGAAPGDAPFRAAVVDGATETAFAGLWARTLADGFVEDGEPGPAPDAAWLGRRQAAWAAAVAPRTSGLPWYAAAKAEQGAAAALLGLTVHPDGRWHACAAGDADLLHLRGDALRAAWPLATPDAFTAAPALLPSRPHQPAPPVLRHAGTWAPGDALVLATDAAAAWLLRTDPAAALGFDAASFPAAVAAARADGVLRNDDVTVVVLRLAGGHPAARTR